MTTEIRTARPLGKQLIRKTAERRVHLTGQVSVDAAATTSRRNDLAPNLAVTEWPIPRLRVADRRARKTSTAQLERVIVSIRRFGIVRPVLVRASGAIIDGHIVVEAASRLGLQCVPCIEVTHLNDAECLALRIALNRIAGTGEWDLAELRNNVELGRHGRDRTNVWSYPGANRRGSSAGKALEFHPTPKPVELVRDAMLDVTERGEKVLDPFMGSGTTLVAAEQCGRVAYGIELDPAYVDVAITRWETDTGTKAVHLRSGLDRGSLAEQRRSNTAAG